MSKKSKSRRGPKRSRKPLSQKPARHSRAPALVLAAILGVFGVVLVRTAIDAERMVIQPHAGRMRLYLGMVAGLSGLSALGLVVGGSGVDRALRKILDRLGDDLRAAWDRASSAIRATPQPVLVALAAVTVLGALVRLRYSGQPMRYDEAYSYNAYGRFPLAVSLSAYDTPNNHILNTLLTHLATSLFGNSEWSVRLPALLFGIALTPAVYVTTRLFAGTGASLLAAAATSGWPVLVEYSANGRGYSAVAFFFMTAVASARLVLEDDRLLYRIGLVGSVVAILYTTPAGVYATAACWAWLLASSAASRKTRPRATASTIAAGVVAAAVTATLYAFPLMVGGFGAVLQRSDIRPRPFGDYLASAPSSLLEIARFVFRAVPIGIAVTVGASALAGIVAAVLPRSRRRGPAGMPAAGLLVALGLTVLQRQWPYTRAWIFVVPLLFLTAAVGLDATGALLSERIRGFQARATVWATSAASLALALFLVGVVMASGAVEKSTDTGYAPDARQAAEFLKGRLETDDAVLARVPADAPLIYYFMRQGMGIEYFRPHDPTRIIVFADGGPGGVEKVLESFGVQPAEGYQPQMIWEGKNSALYRLEKFTTG